MSIAEDEAERVYPTRYWDGTHVKEKFYCDTDDLQEAYLRGREAPPSDVEVEAVAKKTAVDEPHMGRHRQRLSGKGRGGRMGLLRRNPRHARMLRRTSPRSARNRTEGGKRMSKTIRYVECAHCGEVVGVYYVTCPYCGYKLVDAMQAIGEALPW